MDQLVTTVRSVKVDVVAIKEAWQTVSETFYMENYEVIHHLHTNGRDGGVVLFCHMELRPSRLSIEIPEGVQVMWVRTALGYPPPSNCLHPLLCTVSTASLPQQKYNREPSYQYLRVR